MNEREKRFFVLTVKPISEFIDGHSTHPSFVCTACYELRLLEQVVGYTWGPRTLGGAVLRNVVLTLSAFFLPKLS